MGDRPSARAVYDVDGEKLTVVAFEGDDELTGVITSYSIHYTKLYEFAGRCRHVRSSRTRLSARAKSPR